MFGLFSKINRRIAGINSNLFIAYLRKKGVYIGEGTRFFGSHISIDVTRPCLVEIGKDCAISDGVTVLTHGYGWAVFIRKYGEMVNSSGKVIIENNVFIGADAMILKGVTIGSNTIIGARSVVTHDIPRNSVAVGNPCRVIMSIDDYYKKRKKASIEEAKAYAFEIYRKTGKVPKKEDFWEEFPLFLKRDEEWGNLPVKRQLRSAFDDFMKTKPLYPSFEAFLIEAGIPAREIEKVKKRR